MVVKALLCTWETWICPLGREVKSLFEVLDDHEPSYSVFKEVRLGGNYAQVPSPMFEPFQGPMVMTNHICLFHLKEGASGIKSGETRDDSTPPTVHRRVLSSMNNPVPVVPKEEQSLSKSSSGPSVGQEGQCFVSFWEPRGLSSSVCGPALVDWSFLQPVTNCNCIRDKTERTGVKTMLCMKLSWF